MRRVDMKKKKWFIEILTLIYIFVCFVNDGAVSDANRLKDRICLHRMNGKDVRGRRRRLSA